jgi:hypothetical protein
VPLSGGRDLALADLDDVVAEGEDNRLQRRFLVCLTALALVCAALQAVTGVGQLALYLTPLFVIGALLLSGRYIAEDRIVARWRGAPPPRSVRRRSHRWRTRPLLAVRSVFDQGSFGVRGPPASLAPAA